MEKNGKGINVYMQNQWGLSSDHSTPETTVDADLLAQNMVNDPLAIILGPQGQVLKIENGKFEVDKEATRNELAKLERSQ